MDLKFNMMLVAMTILVILGFIFFLLTTRNAIKDHGGMAIVCLIISICCFFGGLKTEIYAFDYSYDKEISMAKELDAGITVATEQEDLERYIITVDKDGVIVSIEKETI